MESNYKESLIGEIKSISEVAKVRKVPETKDSVAGTEVTIFIDDDCLIPFLNFLHNQNNGMSGD